MPLLRTLDGFECIFNIPADAYNPLGNFVAKQLTKKSTIDQIETEYPAGLVPTGLKD